MMANVSIINKLFLHKNRAYNGYSRDKKHIDLLNKFQSLQTHFKTTIGESK